VVEVEVKPLGLAELAVVVLEEVMVVLGQVSLEPLILAVEAVEVLL
jgi:hypothetical protein